MNKKELETFILEVSVHVQESLKSFRTAPLPHHAKTLKQEISLFYPRHTLIPVRM